MSNTDANTLCAQAITKRQELIVLRSSVAKQLGLDVPRPPSAPSVDDAMELALDLVKLSCCLVAMVTVGASPALRAEQTMRSASPLSS